MYELKIHRGVMCHENEECCKNWREIDFSVQNWHEQFDWFKYSKISKMCTLMGCLWSKYIMFDLRKYKGVMFDSTEYWCKIWRKTDFCFQKWHEEFGKFSPEHLKVSKFELFDGILLSKVWAWNLQGSYLSWQWKKMQNWKRNWLVVSKLTWKLEFWPEHSKILNICTLMAVFEGKLKSSCQMHFNGIFLIKLYNVWAKNLQRSYIWCHWRLMQNLRKTDLRFLKWYEQFVKFLFTCWKIAISF